MLSPFIVDLPLLMRRAVPREVLCGQSIRLMICRRTLRSCCSLTRVLRCGRSRRQFAVAPDSTGICKPCQHYCLATGFQGERRCDFRAACGAGCVARCRAVCAQDPERLLGAGLSRPKLKTLLAAAQPVRKALDLHGLCHLPAEQAIATLTVISGIGPWTAEVYLLFAAGHPDIFPSGDIALQNAWQMIFGTDARPSAKELAVLAQIWSPWRGTAARLLWAYYGVKRGLNGKTPV